MSSRSTKRFEKSPQFVCEGFVNRLKNSWYTMLLVMCSVLSCGCANAQDAPAVRVAVDANDDEAPATTADAKLRDGEDWPKFLGPRDDGTSIETGLLAKWPEQGPPMLWEKRVGTGYSAPSVRGNRVVLHHRVRDEEIVDCFAADTGKSLWSHTYESNFSDPYGYNNGPRCSPLLTADRCYTFGAEGKLLCLNLETGKQIWLRDTAAEWKIADAFFGVGSTPILHGKLLIAMVGGEPDAGVVAFDSDTGKTVWHSVNKKTWTSPDGSQLDDKLASYSSLIETNINGHDHVLALMRDGLVSLNPTDGQIRFNYFFRSDSRESVNAARPVIIGDEVLLSAAYKAGAALLKIKPDGKGAIELWKSRNLQTHWSTTIHHEGFLYGFSGRHEGEAKLKCIDLKSGDMVWETDGLPTNLTDDPNDVEASSSRYYGRGSAIMAEGKFIVLGERGLLALVEVNPKEFKEISRVKFRGMKYPSWAAPVLSRKRLYLRCEDHMLCLDLAAQK
jgi:outer membrane protein assembly factor BamB